MEASLVLPARRPFPVARLVVLLVSSFAVLAVLLHARSEVVTQRAFDHSVAQVHVLPPDGVPEVGQESLDLALTIYGIEIPAGAEHPKFDPELHDRGLTSRGAFMEKAKVAIGPAAFTSWGLLGSTLAHELEIHCNQNFLGIYLMDLVGLDGTGAAERQAYIHELRGAHRFGLDDGDAAMIADTMEYYYPDTSTGPGVYVPRSVRTWMARNLLRDQRAF